MKILIVEPHALRPGPAMYAEQFCDALADRGHDVALLTAAGILACNPQNRSWQHIKTLHHRTAFVVGRDGALPPVLRRLVTSQTQWAVADRAFALVRRGNYHAVHFLSTEPMTLALAYFLNGAPAHVFATNRGYEFARPAPDADAVLKICQFLRRLFWKTLGRSIRVLVESESIKRQIEADRIVPIGSTVVIPHPVWSSSDGRRLPKTTARKRLGIDYKGPLLLMFGHRPRLQKSPETLAAALKGLDMDCRIIIAGAEADSESEQQLWRMIDEAGWTDRVYRRDTFIPNDLIQTYFRAADAAILSYRSDYYSSSGVLSLACEYRLPVIASDAGDLGRTVLEYGIGLTFEARNPDSLREAITRFAGLTKSQITRIKKNMKTLNDERSWPNIAERHAGVYRTGRSLTEADEGR
jgi:glycosyltransferase involved in cell wall biosynthesis